MKRKLILCLLITVFLTCSSHKPKSLGPSGEDIKIEQETPTIQLSLPWKDDFEDGKPDGWLIYNDVETSETTWIVENGLLVQGSAVGTNETKPNDFLGTHIVAGDENWQDYSISARLLNRDNGGTGILFRCQNPENYYRFLILEAPADGAPLCRLDKRVQGKFTILAEKINFDTPGRNITFNAGIRVKNDSIAAFINNKSIFRIQDTTFTRGKIGFACYKNRGLCIDEVRVNAAAIGFKSFEDDSTAIRIRTDHQCGNYSFAIRGIVFKDLNGNNQQDFGEKGLPDIAVSDGRDIVFTNAHGIYSLPNKFKDTQFVFVCIPAEFKKTQRFYHQPNDSMGQQLFNFALESSSENEELPFSFIQTSDIHLENPADTAQFKELLLEFTQSAPSLKFAVATGDLVENGSVKAQMRSFQQAIREFPIPFYSVCGEHDLDNGLNRLRNFHHFLGPDYFSFDVADCHIVCYNNSIISEKQNEWLEKDLTFCGLNKRILIFQHFPPAKKQLERLSTFNIKAIFSGHYHSNKVIRCKNIMLYNTAPLRFGGIDMSPAGFRVVTIERDTIYSHYRFGGIHEKITVVTPVDSAIILKDSLDIVVNIYDTKQEVKYVGFQLIKVPNVNEIGRLRQKGCWSWVKKINGDLPEGLYRLKITAITNTNQTWQTSTQFSIQAEKQLRLAPAEDWPAFKKNNRHSGISRSELRPPLKILWVKSTGGSIDFASPVFYHGKIFIAVKDRDNLDNNYICALNALNGDLLWGFETPAAVHHSVACCQDKVIAQDVQGRIFALEEDTGDIFWQQALCEDETRFWLYSAPIIVNGICYAGNAAGMAALTVESGNILWQKQLRGDWIASYASPAYYDGMLFIGSIRHEKNLCALNASNGHLLWAFKLSGTNSAALVDDGMLYVETTSGELVAIHADNGVETWRTKLGDGWAPATPTVVDSIVLAGSGDGYMVALNRHTGKIIWKFQCAESLVRIAPYRSSFQALTGSPVVSGNTVYFGSSDGFLYALKLHTGKLLWKHNFGSPVLSTPAITGNALFIAAYDGNVYALAAR